jgi:hypothetical protein
MKGILIDSVNQTITETTISKANFLKEAYEKIGCQWIEGVDILGYKQRHTMYVDEEGRLNSVHETGFTMNGQDYIGNALMVGFDAKNGSDTDCSILIQDVERNIIFKNREDLDDEVRIEFIAYKS